MNSDYTFQNTDFQKCLKCKESYAKMFRFPTCIHIFCPECLCGYLDQFTSANIACPSDGCMELIPDHIIRQCLSNTQLILYDKLSYPAIAVKCMINECPYYAASEDKQGRFVCPICRQPNCLFCCNLHPADQLCGKSKDLRKMEQDAAENLKTKRRSDLLQLTKDSCLVINPERSECQICLCFLLPREGILTSSCLHSFCRKCLQTQLTHAQSMFQFSCVKCEAPLENGECRELIGDVEMETLNLKTVKYKFFHCQTPDCKSFWDPGYCRTTHTCPACQKVNCIPCGDIHEGQSCVDYQKSQKYKDRQADKKLMESQKAVHCFQCNYMLVKNGGCNALRCPNCSKQICAYSGKELGPTGCKCRYSKRCHKDCKIGCVPEGDSKYEFELRKYFNNN